MLQSYKDQGRFLQAQFSVNMKVPAFSPSSSFLRHSLVNNILDIFVEPGEAEKGIEDGAQICFYHI